MCTKHVRGCSYLFNSQVIVYLLEALKTSIKVVLVKVWVKDWPRLLTQQNVSMNEEPGVRITRCLSLLLPILFLCPSVSLFHSHSLCPSPSAPLKQQGTISIDQTLVMDILQKQTTWAHVLSLLKRERERERELVVTTVMALMRFQIKSYQAVALKALLSNILATR